MDVDPEALVYLAAVFIGVPLTAWELWHLGQQSEVAALAGLWVPTVGFLVVDIARGHLSRWSVALFFTWVAVVLGGGIYAYVV